MDYSEVLRVGSQEATWVQVAISKFSIQNKQNQSSHGRGCPQEISRKKNNRVLFIWKITQTQRAHGWLLMEVQS